MIRFKAQNTLSQGVITVSLPRVTVDIRLTKWGKLKRSYWKGHTSILSTRVLLVKLFRAYSYPLLSPLLRLLCFLLYLYELYFKFSFCLPLHRSSCTALKLSELLSESARWCRGSPCFLRSAVSQAVLTVTLSATRIKARWLIHFTSKLSPPDKFRRQSNL